jgi:hypothetical protein
MLASGVRKPAQATPGFLLIYYKFTCLGCIYLLVRGLIEKKKGFMINHHLDPREKKWRNEGIKQGSL